MPEITIKDVARVSGYSIKTVSRVVNKQPTVAKDIREKVEAVVAELNYQPNKWARSLRSSRSHLLALISYGSSVSYISQVQLAAAWVCHDAGYHVMSEIVPRSDHSLPKVVKSIASAIHLDGVLLVPPAADNLILMKALTDANLPFVRISPSRHLDLGSYVYVDDHKVAFDITQYLIDLGHRDIAFVGGPQLHAAAAKRQSGFEAAMRENGIAIAKSWTLRGEFDVKSGMQAGEALFSGRKWPTAVIGSNDETAIGIMAAAYSKGAVIPRDVSIVGIDDAPIASSFWPPLTTVRQPVADLGRAATEILIAEIETPCERRVEKLECGIVVRESAGRPPDLEDDPAQFPVRCSHP
jgi:LacI family transcriptional regulator